jgi:hypothetical protein
MVLTRRQEQLLKKQYRISDGEGKSPNTPQTPKEMTLPDGRRLKSALKTHDRLRPWETPEPYELETTAAPDTRSKKRVRIYSRNNSVHVFESEADDYADNQPQEEEGNSDEEEYLNDENSNNRMQKVAAGAGGNDGQYRKNGVRRRRGGTSNVWAAIATMLVWAVSSSWLIFYMQDAMRWRGLPFPLFLPSISQFACALMVWGAASAGFAQIRPWPPVAVFSRQLLPMAASATMCMMLGNIGYFGLSVAFMSILKSLVPAATLIVSAAAGTEQPSAAGLVATLLIAYGTGVATVQETSHNTDFKWVPFVCFTTSIVFEASRVVLISKLMSGTEKPYSAIEVMAHIGPLVGTLTGIASLVLEWEGLKALGFAGLVKSLPHLAMICILSFAVNVSSYLAIRYTSSTTFKVAGCVKNAATIWLGVLRGEVVTMRELQGFAVSTVGFLLYTWARQIRNKSATSSGVIDLRKRLKKRL